MAREIWYAAGAVGLLWLLRPRKVRTCDVGDCPSIADWIVPAALAEVGVREDLGKNDGTRIREYWAGTGLGPPANWCAAFVRFVLRRAAEEAGTAPPVAGSAGAKDTMEQFKRAGRWLPVDEARADPSLVEPGMVPVWDRSQPGRPETSWFGHIGFVVGPVIGTSFETVEGNSGPTGEEVVRWKRDLSDPRLYGFGIA